VAQLIPEYPVVQLHTYALIPSIHYPPLRHGFTAHSFIFTSQAFPDHPGLQAHE